MKANYGFMAVGLVLTCVCGCSAPSESMAKPGESAPVVEAPAEAEKDDKETPAAPAGKKGEITDVDLNRLLQLQDDGDAYLIDVRPRLFYGLGHIPGAISLPKKSFPLAMEKSRVGIDAARDAGKVLVLYCQNVSCPDGYAVAKEMSAMGYAVSIYKGGWEEWDEMGF